jgi:hypothetical protein
VHFEEASLFLILNVCFYYYRTNEDLQASLLNM